MTARRRAHIVLGASIALLAGADQLLGQHTGDIAVGRSAAGQLKYKPFDANYPCFDPAAGIGLLIPIPDPPAPPTSWRATDPGFDANFDPAPEYDFYSLAYGAAIHLVAYEDMTPAFRVRYGSANIRYAGDSLPLGSDVLHRHVQFIVDCNDPAYDPLRTLWYGTFILDDRGSTQYADSEPFTIRLSIVECVAGDVTGDGTVDFEDINPFVAVMVNPAAATVAERCAADVDRDGYVTFADINPFVAILSAGA